MEIKTETVKCPICKNSNSSFQESYRNKSPQFNNLNRFLCNNCQLVFASPMPNDTKLNDYNSNYHLNAHGGHERDIKLNAFFVGIAKTRLITIKKNIKVDPKKDYKVLEIGPGPGTFACQWLKENTNTEYYAFETDVTLHKSLKKLGIKLIDEYSINSLEKYFDFIVISHVLEHVSKPLDFLSKYLFLLKDGGHLYIEVPCNDWQHKNIDEPHLLFFDKKSMIMLAKKLKIAIVFIGYFGTKIKHLRNPFFRLIKIIREKLFYRNINFFHPEKSKLKRLLGSELESNAIINFSAHIEQKEPAWWLRVIIKK